MLCACYTRAEIRIKNSRWINKWSVYKPENKEVENVEKNVNKAERKQIFKSS